METQYQRNSDGIETFNASPKSNYKNNVISDSSQNGIKVELHPIQMMEFLKIIQYQIVMYMQFMLTMQTDFILVIILCLLVGTKILDLTR